MEREKVTEALSQVAGKKITRRMALKGAGAVAGAVALAGMPVGTDLARAAAGSPQDLLTPSSTVFMLDKSRSMFLNDCFSGAREATLALDALVRSQFPRDNLYFVEFSYLARQIQPSDLPQLTWDEYTYGTNVQQGLMLARQLLAQRAAQNKQVIIVTDGEPTTHLEPGNPEPVFSYPPTPRCLAATLREVECATRENIVIHTFMLQPSSQPSSFVEQMTSINGGRAFYVSPDHLEEDLLAHYVRTKSTTIP